MSYPMKTQLPPSEPRLMQLTADATIEVEGAAGADGQTMLPRFRMLAYTGTPMRVGGWRHPVILDLAGLSIPSQSRPIRFGHDPLSGVGHTDSIRVEQGQLVASGLVSRDTAAAREVVTSSRNGFPWQASVGASVEEFEFVKESQQVTVNGRQYTGPLNVVRRSTLGEISFVDLGADGSTNANVTATSADTDPDDSLHDHVDADDPSASGSQRAATSIAPCTPMPAMAAADTVTRLRNQAVAEIERIDGIRTLCAGRQPKIEAQAIRDGWDLQRTELELLRQNRPTAPAVHVQNTAVNAQVLEAACLMTGGSQNLETMFDDRTLQLANDRYRSGLGLQELFLEAAWANGYTGRNFRDSRAVMRFAFGRDIEAGWSTIDIGGILSNVANKFLLEGFFSVERVWRNICAVRNVSDFKTVTSYRLIGKDQYEQVAPGGELKHGTLGNEQYSNKADTYGLMLSIDRRDIINDDLGAITTVPRKLGRGSGLKINDVFWTIFLNNAAFFVAGNKNYQAGTDTVLTIDGMTKAEVTFMDQVDGDGKPIGVMPAIVLVPTALSAVGTQLYKSVELRDNTANAKSPTNNPHQGKFRVEVSRYLANASYTGNSVKAWYLLSEPNDLPVIEVAFLNGQESPTIETAEADFNVLGVKMRGYHDFGVALQDPRGGVKMKGEV
ncbi:MAG: hypothetical protein JNM43_19205 [Planctomycetaceae bacterium]|jgi:hypothetical protein|nr:hypothetical protein [Planctomycetaceae bacterium]